MTSERIRHEMSCLYRILDAGEKGYAVSALNINNRGLKALFKSYAQQRARFKADILAEMQRLGLKAKTKNSLLGAIHRGRINIFAALTIGKEIKEQVVLKEILIGEKIALRTYIKLLEEELHPDMIKLLSHHLSELRRIVDQLQFMRGREGKRMVLRLFDNNHDLETALKKMLESGLRLESVIWLNFKDVIELYEGSSTAIVAETVFSGAVGGAFWGSLISVLAGIGMQIAGTASAGMLVGQGMWPMLAFAGILAGGLVGAALGFAIGVGVADEDAYLYDQSIKRGKIILMTIVDSLRATEAANIMALVNARARAQAD